MFIYVIYDKNYLPTTTTTVVDDDGVDDDDDDNVADAVVVATTLAAAAALFNSCCCFFNFRFLTHQSTSTFGLLVPASHSSPDSTILPL